MSNLTGPGASILSYASRTSKNQPIYFSYRSQIWKLCFILTIRWFVTIGLCAATLLVMWFFSDEYTDTLTRQNKKSVYNLLITGLAVGIAANLSDSFNQSVQKVRWYFISRIDLPADLFESIFSSNDLCSVVGWTWKAFKVNGVKGLWKLRLAGIFWLFLYLILQTAPVLLGLTCSILDPVEMGDDTPAFHEGSVMVANLSYFQETSFHPGAMDRLTAQRAAINCYGLEAAEYGFDELRPESLKSSQYRNLYAEDGTSIIWPVVMSDQGPISTQNLYIGNTVNSNRAFNITATCEEKEILAVQSSNGFRSTISYREDHETRTLVFEEPTANRTTYSFSNQTAGPRSTQVWVFWSGQRRSSPSEKLYLCNNTVSHVYESPDSPKSAPRYCKKPHAPIDPAYHDMMDEQAQILAGAIGWGSLRDPRKHYLAQYENTRSAWALTDPIEPARVADSVSRFSAGALLSLDRRGPKIKVNTTASPRPRTVLHVDWRFAGPTLAAIVAGHFVFLLLPTLWFARRVRVPDDDDDSGGEHGGRDRGAETATGIWVALAGRRGREGGCVIVVAAASPDGRDRRRGERHRRLQSGVPGRGGICITASTGLSGGSVGSE